jgi:non-ribosomal peptide synthetase component F
MTVLSKNVLTMFLEVACAYPNQVAIELDEQIWTYGELLTSVIRVVHRLDIEAGQIIYQYVDRSLEMVCGMLGIMCAGGVYCPLNPSDPPIRTRSLLDEIQGRVALIHESTRDKFSSMNNQDIQLIDLDQLLSMNITVNNVIEKGNFVLLN